MARAGSYVSLHNHTEHSKLDGLSRVRELCGAAAADGHPAVGISDHGTMSGTFKFAAAARKAGVKPLMGFEAYLAIGSRHDQNSIEVPRDDAESDADDDGTGKGSTKVKRYEHITLLASDTDGWANLCKLTSFSHDSFWYKPRIDFELMAEHNRGIIALTGCLGGPVAGRLLRGDKEGAYQAAADLVDMYGRTNVFAEVMDHGIAVERVLMPQLVELAKHFGIRTVATNDTHFVTEGDAHAHDAWLCVAQNKKVADDERWRFNGAGYHMRTAAEMRALFDDQNGTSEAVDSTLLIAERCADNILPESRLRLPKYTSPEMGDRDSDKYLYDLVVEGARARFGTLTDKIKARLRFEFDMISSKGLSDYFLIQWDIICEARRRGIRVGPGRGSAAGCLISYCLTIVNVDPLENDLLFERFLNPDRVSMPDIDTDYDSAGRDEMIRYTAERFGLDFVARIGTFGQALSRRSIRDAARVLDLAPIGDELARLVPIGANGKPASIESMIAATQGNAVVAAADGDDAWGETSAGSNSGSTRDSSVNAAARDFMAAAQASDLHRQVFELAAAFENRINQEGIHACGVVVADEPLYGMVPLRTDHKKGPNQGQLVTQWDGKDIDTFGLLKMDFLALLNLDIITACEKFIRARSGEEVDGDNPPIFPAGTGATALTRRGERFTTLEQERVERTWALIRSGRTSGVFQLESRGMTELCTKVEASSLAELSAIIALFRPGPLAANMHVHYADRKHGVEEIDYGIFTKGSPNEAAEQAAIATVLGDSLGVCIFQESMMRLGSVVAGFGPSERNRLQKAVSKKIKEEVDAVGEMFFSGGVSDAAMDGTPKLAFAETTVGRVWDAIKGAAAYAFNASHSYAYAWLAYCTAYLKANWTAEYGAALLSVTEKAERRQMVLAALRTDGVTVLGPSVNESRFTTSVDESGAVRIGLSEIKDVGSDIVHLIDERDANGPFTSLSDVAVRVKWTPDGETKPKSIPSDKLVALIEAGAFDDFGPRLGQAMIAKAVSKAPSIAVIDAEWPQLERAARERDRLKVLLSPHPLATMHDLRSWRSRAGERPCSVANIPTNDGDRCLVLGMIASWEERAYSGGRMARFTLEGSTGSLEGVVWAGTVRKLAELGTTPKPGVIAAIQGRVAIRELRTHDDGGAESDTGQAAEETIELLGNDVFLVNADDPMRLDLEPGPVLDLSVGGPAIFDLQLVTAPPAPGTPEPYRALSDPVVATPTAAEPEPEVAGPLAGTAAPPEPPIERPMSTPRARPIDPALAERTTNAPAPSQTTNGAPDTPAALSTVPVSLPGVVTELERGLSTLSPEHGALIGGHLYLAVSKGAGVITPRSVRILLDTHFPGLWTLIAERLRDTPPRRGTMVALPTRSTWTTPVWAIQACDRPVVELVQEMTDAGAHTDALSELHSH